MVQEAASGQQAASFHAGRHPAQAGVNRRLPTGEGVTMRPNPEGPVSPWVCPLRADTDSGNPLALLFSHAAHPAIVRASSTLISADYPGHAVASIKSDLRDDVAALFAQGCGANINGEPLRAGHAAAEEAGRQLGEAALRSWGASQRLPDSALKTASTTLELPWRTTHLTADAKRRSTKCALASWRRKNTPLRMRKNCGI